MCARAASLNTAMTLLHHGMACVAGGAPPTHIYKGCLLARWAEHYKPASVVAIFLMYEL